MIERIEFAADRVNLLFSGKVTGKEIVAANQQVMDHEDFPRFRRALWQFRCVTDAEMDTHGMNQLVRQSSGAQNPHPDLKVAIVADTDVVFGFGRMYASFIADELWQTQVFGSTDEAEAWLAA